MRSCTRWVSKLPRDRRNENKILVGAPITATKGLSHRCRKRVCSQGGIGFSGGLPLGAVSSARNHSEVVDSIKWFLERSNPCASVSIRGPYPRAASNGQKFQERTEYQPRMDTDAHGFYCPANSWTGGHYT